MTNKQNANDSTNKHCYDFDAIGSLNVLTYSFSLAACHVALWVFSQDLRIMLCVGSFESGQPAWNKNAIYYGLVMFHKVTK